MKKILVTGLSLAVLLPAAACMTTDAEEADEIASALELENGGFSEEDEAPAFGDSALFADADIADGVEYDDPMSRDADVVTMMEAPDAALFHTAIMWGQMPGDRTVTEARNWSGAWSVNRGGIVVRRTIRFEGLDRILPRTDRATVAFRSVTRPHYDGIIVTVVDPDPLAAEPLVLTYTLADGTAHELPMATLLEGPQSRVVDDLGNRITAGAIARLIDDCAHGRLRGRWHKVAPNRGVFLGGVSNAIGERIGHVRGIYGKKANGDQVFFGKYINSAGEFKGIFRGEYDEGHFAGRWLNRDGEVGALGGEYRETVPGPRTGGHFLGRWTELSCDVPLPRPPAN